MHRHIAVHLAVVLAVFGIAGTAFAAKGGNGGGGSSSSSSIALVALDGGARTTAASTYRGAQVTFDVSTGATSKPWVEVRCSQGGTLVYNAWHGFFDGYYTQQVFTLSSDWWVSGPASCSARLVSFDRNGRDSTLATTSFEASG